MCGALRTALRNWRTVCGSPRDRYNVYAAFKGTNVPKPFTKRPKTRTRCEVSLIRGSMSARISEYKNDSNKQLKLLKLYFVSW